MEQSTFTTTDKCQISYVSTPPTNSSTCILLLHGFSGSHEYFKHNIPTLSQQHPVIAWDMRGHGQSAISKGGYHVARLATDLYELLAHLRKADSESKLSFVGVGCSIGAAVLWTYIELFGTTPFSGFIFVDQAPLQNRSPRGNWDERFAHTGCYDLATTLAAQEAWSSDRADAQKGLIEGCLGYFHPSFPAHQLPSESQRQADFEFFNNISLQCPDGEWLGLLIADHTAYDHREALELVDVPTLVVMGRYSGCFTLEGLRESVRRVNLGEVGKAKGGRLARESVFECGHWLFYEDAERFNREVLEFVGGLDGS